MFPSNQVIEIISYLLPGFLAAWLFFGLTAHPKPSQFERLVHALIFTALCQVITTTVRWTSLTIGARSVVFGAWTERVEFAWTMIAALFAGVTAAWAANTDTIHAALR